MNRIEAYFDQEIGAWMLKGTRRKSNKIYPDQASAERAARRAEKARQSNYKGVKVSYDDIYLVSITADDMPNSPINGYRNRGTAEGSGFKNAFEDIWDDTSATRTLGELVDMAKTDSDVSAFLSRLFRTHTDPIVHKALTVLLDYPEE